MSGPFGLRVQDYRHGLHSTIPDTWQHWSHDISFGLRGAGDLGASVHRIIRWDRGGSLVAATQMNADDPSTRDESVTSGPNAGEVGLVEVA